jgi:glycosyltransferase involved in cell wall biosynthesis
MEMKKSRCIVIDTRMINSSGIGRYLQNILPEIVKYFPNTILLGDAELLKKKSNYSNLNIIPFNKSIYSVSEQLEYTKIVPACDIFFSPHYNVPLLPIKAKYRITTIHDVFHLAYFQDLSISQKIYAKLLINQALKKSDCIITVSEFSKKEILKYTNTKYERKISVIHNGVILNKKLSENHNYFYDNKAYFLFVGNVKPHKNLRRAIEAFRLLLLDCEQYQYEKPHFIIVGKREGFITSDNNISNLIASDPLLLNNVTFTGWISDEELNRLYANTLALVFPSYYEGFGFPPLEAMSIGAPVIVANRASLPEVCGNAVLYFDPYDVMDIYSKMKYIFSNENIRKDLIERGMHNVRKFTKEFSINSHIQLFEKYVNK